MDVVDKLLLEHADVPYDPAKRREYYLKARELKGRKPKKEVAKAVSKATIKKSVAPSRQLTANEIKWITAVNNQKNAVKQRRAAVEAKVKELNDKLKRLREILKGLKSDSDKEDTKKSEAAKKAAETRKQKDKDLTSAQKKEAAEKAKERREKEADASPDKRLEEVMKKIDAVQNQIREAREKLQKGRR